MTFYGDMQKIAAGVLKQFDQGITYVAVTKGAGPAYNRAAPAKTPTVLPGAVARGVSAAYAAQAAIVGADLEITSSIVAGIDPKPGDQLTVNNKPVTIMTVIKIPASGTAVVWKFLAKSGIN